MTHTDTMVQMINSLITTVNSIVKDFANEQTTFTQNVTTIKAKHSQDLDSVEQQLNSQLSLLKNQRDSAVMRYQQQIDTIKQTEAELENLFSRKRVDFNKLSQPSKQYDRGDAEQLIEEVSKSGFWAWVMRLITGRSKESVAGELYLRIDNAVKHLKNQIQATENNFANACVKQNRNRDHQSTQLDQICNQEISREQKRHDQANMALTTRQKQFENSKALIDLESIISQTLSNLHGTRDSWNKFHQSTQLPKEVLFGRILYPINIPHPSPKHLEMLRKIPNYVESKNSIALPYIIGENHSNLIYCDCSTSTEIAAEIYRYHILRQVKYMPMHSFRTIITDPVNRGRALGSLMHLTSQNQGCGICEYHLSNRDISDMLDKLTKHVDAICRKLTSVNCVNIDEYNSRLAKDRIPYTTLIIHDYPLGLDSQSLDQLRVIIEQAKQCGISLFISHKQNDKLENNALKLIQNYASKFIIINFNNGQLMIQDPQYKDRMPYLPIDIQVSNNYLNEVNKAYMYVKPIDNRFPTFFPQDKMPVQRQTVKGLDLPFAIDSKGQLIELSIGYDSSAYGFICGGVGSGKTVLLHTLITSSILHYSPEELQLWLVDYKKVFDFYTLHCPKQVKYVITDKSDEISYSVIDEIDEEISRRQQLFNAPGVFVEDFEVYRKKYKLPKVLVIIDEFHRMSQALEDDPEYKEKFENIFHEARSHGIVLLLCDQFITGLKGLSDNAKKLISVRISMRQADKSDIEECLNIRSGQLDETTRGLIENLISAVEGTFIYKHETSTGVAGAFFKKVELISGRGLYLDKGGTERVNYIELANKNNKNTAYKSEFYTGIVRYPFDKKTIQQYEQSYAVVDNQIERFYIGSPLGIKKCFPIDIKCQIGEDIMLIGKNKELQFSIIYSIIACAIRYQYKVIVLIPRTSSLFKDNRGFFESIPGAELYTSFPEICHFVGQKANELKNNFASEDFFDQEQDAIGEKTFVLWLEADIILEMMEASNYTQTQAWSGVLSTDTRNESYPPPQPKSTTIARLSLSEKKVRNNGANTITSQEKQSKIAAENDSPSQTALDSLEQVIAQRLKALDGQDVKNEMNGTIPESFMGLSTSTMTGYNATQDSGLLLANGYKLNMHALFVMDNAVHLRTMRYIKLDGTFNHRIALPMSPDEASSFMAQTRVIKTYNDNGNTECAFYSYNGGREKVFRPYYVK